MITTFEKGMLRRAELLFGQLMMDRLIGMRVRRKSMVRFVP